MIVKTTDNRKERVQFDKITARVSRLCYGLDADHVDAAAITQKVISGVYQGVTTIELDNLVRITLGFGCSRANVLGRRNRRIHDRHSSRLCHSGGTDRRLKFTQADKEAVLLGYRGFVSLRQPEEQQASRYDFGNYLRNGHEAR